MPLDDDTISLAQKLKLLRKLEILLGQTERLLARDAGLTEEEIAILANTELIEVSFFQDDGPVLDRYHIDKILPKGLAILADDALAAPDPLLVTVLPQHKSISRHIFDQTRSGLWDLIKIAFGAAIGALITWLLTKHYSQYKPH
jgi:hypothetical protein